MGPPRETLRRVATASEEAALKAARNYGGAEYALEGGAWSTEPHFGFLIVS